MVLTGHCLRLTLSPLQRQTRRKAESTGNGPFPIPYLL